MDQRPAEDFGQRDRDRAPSPPARREATIIVPLDGSVHATVALPVARVMAELEDATLHVVHVGEPTLPPREQIQRLGLPPEMLRGSVIDQTAGTPAAGIVRLARERQCALIVMSTHTGQEERQRELGPVAEEVLCLAPCPVLLVRQERGLPPWELRRILLPHDGTPSTAVAIGPAADLARRSGAELLVLHVAGPQAGQPAESGTYAGPRYLDQPQYEWPAWGSEFLERLSALGHPPAEVKMLLFLTTGEPGAEVVRFAAQHNADLIVLGWHGRLEPQRAATLRMVIGAASCPVLMVRLENRGRKAETKKAV